MASAQGFLSTWSLEPTAIPEEVDRVVVSSPAPPRLLVLLQTRPRHQARGPRREHQGQAGERPPFSTLRARPYEHPISCCAATEVQILPQLAAGGLASGGRQRRRGASPIQSQRIRLMLLKHMTALRQGVAPRAPEVMLDDAVQAHPGRLRLQRL